MRLPDHARGPARLRRRRHPARLPGADRGALRSGVGVDHGQPRPSDRLRARRRRPRDRHGRRPHRGRRRGDRPLRPALHGRHAGAVAGRGHRLARRPGARRRRASRTRGTALRNTLRSRNGTSTCSPTPSRRCRRPLRPGPADLRRLWRGDRLLRPSGRARPARAGLQGGRGGRCGACHRHGPRARRTGRVH